MADADSEDIQAQSSASRSASREGLLETLGAVFESRGYDGATLSLLSAATGLGKASLYHPFPGAYTDFIYYLFPKKQNLGVFNPGRQGSSWG